MARTADAPTGPPGSAEQAYLDEQERPERSARFLDERCSNVVPLCVRLVIAYPDLYIYMYIYVYIYVYMFRHIYICIYTYMNMGICICVYIEHACIYVLYMCSPLFQQSRALHSR